MSQKRRNCLILYKTISKLFSKVALIRLYIQTNHLRIWSLNMITLGLQKKKTLPFFFKHLNLNAFSCESDVKVWLIPRYRPYFHDDPFRL